MNLRPAIYFSFNFGMANKYPISFLKGNWSGYPSSSTLVCFNKSQKALTAFSVYAYVNPFHNGVELVVGGRLESVGGGKRQHREEEKIGQKDKRDQRKCLSVLTPASPTLTPASKYKIPGPASLTPWLGLPGMLENIVGRKWVRLKWSWLQLEGLAGPHMRS